MYRFVAATNDFLDVDKNDVTENFNPHVNTCKLIFKNYKYEVIQCFSAFDCFNYIHNRNGCRIGVNDIDADYWFNDLIASKHANCYIKYSEPNFGSFQNVKVYIEYPNNKIERIEKDGTITGIKKLPWK